MKKPMVRKQLYLERRQQTAIARQAKVRHLSEAEVIRQALDAQLGAGPSLPAPADEAAWRAARAFMEALRTRRPPAGRPRSWKREDAYEERLSRHGRNPG